MWGLHLQPVVLLPALPPPSSPTIQGGKQRGGQSSSAASPSNLIVPPPSFLLSLLQRAAAASHPPEPPAPRARRAPTARRQFILKKKIKNPETSASEAEYLEDVKIGADSPVVISLQLWTFCVQPGLFLPFCRPAPTSADGSDSLRIYLSGASRQNNCEDYRLKRH